MEGGSRERGWGKGGGGAAGFLVRSGLWGLGEGIGALRGGYGTYG